MYINSTGENVKKTEPGFFSMSGDGTQGNGCSGLAWKTVKHHTSFQSHPLPLTEGQGRELGKKKTVEHVGSGKNFFTKIEKEKRNNNSDHYLHIIYIIYIYIS